MTGEQSTTVVEKSHGKKAFKAASFVVIGYGLSQGIRLLGNIVLTRLLVPEFFGIIALSQVVFHGLFLFSDLGIAESIIRSPKANEPNYLNTAWTLQVIRGFILSFLMILIAYPVAKFYDESSLIYIIPVLGLNSTLMGFLSTSLINLNKELKLGIITYMELIVQCVSIVIMIVIAYYFKTIWALVIGMLSGSLLKVIWSHNLKNQVRNKFHLEKVYANEMLHFGKWILFSTAMMFLATQADRLLFGKLFPLAFFGIYNVAVIFAELPKQVMVMVSGKVLFPLISAFVDLPRKELRLKIKKQRIIMLLPLILLIALFSCFGDILVLKLYDQRYEQAAWILPLLALGIWPLILYSTIDRVFFAIGKPTYPAIGNLVKFIYMIIFVPLLYHISGKFGAVLAVAMNDIPVYLIVLLGLIKEKLSLIKQDIVMTILLFFIISIFVFIRMISGMGFPGASVFLN